MPRGVKEITKWKIAQWGIKEITKWKNEQWGIKGTRKWKKHTALFSNTLYTPSGHIGSELASCVGGTGFDSRLRHSDLRRAFTVCKWCLGILPCKWWGVTAGQFNLQSLTPLPLASCA